MNRFTLYCTAEQTKKVFELGAPIEVLPNYTEFRGLPFVKSQDGNEFRCVPPTAEQMIGWLEEQEGMYEIKISTCCIEIEKRTWYFVIIDKDKLIISLGKEFESRKEATLAAIDAALEYLKKMKEG